MASVGSSGYHASDGAAYERFLGRWTERLALVFADFADLADDGTALDVGCGTGTLAAESRAASLVAKWSASTSPHRLAEGLSRRKGYLPLTK